MALSVSSLQGKIIAAIQAEFGTADAPTQLSKYAHAMAVAIIDEITSNAVVPATGTVTSGPGAGGSVTTAGTVT